MSGRSRRPSSWRAWWAVAAIASVAIGATVGAATTAALAQSQGSSRGQGGGGQAAPPTLTASWWDRTAPGTRGLPTSRFYSLRSDLPDELTRELADHLDTMYVEYARRLASLGQRAPAPLNVFMFATQRDYLDTMRTQFGVTALGSAGIFFVTPRGAGLAFFVERTPRRRLLHVIQHEGFHQFAFSRFGTDLPPWVNEGLAEFFGEAAVVGRDVVIGQGTAATIDAVKSAVESNASIPFLEMLTMTPQSWNGRVQGGNAALQYQQAWSMVHFLVFGGGARYQKPFETYLRLINEGVLSEPAFVRAFGPDIDAFERAWKEYAKSARPGAFVTAMERATFLAEGMLELKRRGQMPTSFEELKQMLVEIDFTWEITGHGHSTELKASDPRLFEIPPDDLCRETPVFALEPSRPKRQSLRERKAEERSATPMRIVTKGVRPKELAVVWMRLDEGDEFAWEFDAK